MNVVNFVQQEKKIGLLSLPNSDCFTGATASSKAKSTPHQDNAQAPKHTGQLVLMQLPKGVSISDIAFGGCHFLAPKAEAPNANSHNSSTTSHNSHIRQAALVVASKKQTFSVSRLETSNSLVLVPPVNNNAGNDAKENNTINSQTTEDGPVSKKPKVVPSLVPVPARLLTPGGSGASFLELRPKLLRPGDLAEILQKHVFDPYHNNINNTTTLKVVDPYSNAKTSSSTKKTTIVGRTVPSLARELQSSPGQVEEALGFLQSFPMPPRSKDDDDDDDQNESIIYYGVLSEEALQEAQNAIIATLAESDDFGDYAGEGVSVDDFVAQVLERLSGDHPMDGEHVIRYALTLFLPKAEKDAANSTNAYDPIGNLTGTLPLDVTKVSI